jgi:wyosine [tRNA(Phe)-imidazoG37] synthetase (radical SAM superfamily)
MSSVYGPVMSWRYGRSLGIDPVPPPKRCSFNCVYCQLGPNKIPIRSVDTVQHGLPDESQILNDLDEYLRQISIGSLDVVTFSGSGEPTANLHLGEMVSTVRKHLPELPVVLLTNGSFLGDPRVMKNLCEFDIVTVKFDAGDDKTHRKINRPCYPFHHDQLAKGIQNLRKTTRVTIALEVMLLKLTSGVSNVSGPARKSLVSEIIKLAPIVDLVQLYTPWRPPVEQDVQPISTAQLKDFGSELSDAYDSERIWIYGIHDARIQSASWKSHQSLREDVLLMLQRRPCRLRDLVQSLDIPTNSLLSLISQLRRSKLITARQYQNEIYYFHQNSD